MRLELAGARGGQDPVLPENAGVQPSTERFSGLTSSWPVCRRTPFRSKIATFPLLYEILRACRVPPEISIALRIYPFIIYLYRDFRGSHVLKKDEFSISMCQNSPLCLITR